MTDKHASKASEEAMRENDAHAAVKNPKDHVPGGDTTHGHSHAAHLEPKGATSNPNETGGAKLGEVRGSAIDKREKVDEQLRGH